MGKLILLVYMGLAFLRIYLCKRVKYNLLLGVLYPFCIIIFSMLALSIIFDGGGSLGESDIHLLLYIGVMVFIYAAIVSLKNIYGQVKSIGLKKYNKKNIIWIIFMLIFVISIIPALTVSLIIPFIDIPIVIWLIYNRRE